MQLLVIGATGFVGHWLYRLAKDRGWRVWGTTTQYDSPNFLHFDMQEMGVEQVLNHVELNPEEPIWAVNCAAIAKIETCTSYKRQTYQLNVESTKQLLADLITRGIRPIHLSTDYVFDGRKGNYSETDPVCPLNEYGRQKAHIETWMADAYPTALTLRLSMVVGPSDDNKHLFSHWYRTLNQGRAIRCIAGQKFSPTDVRDVAAGIILAIENRLHGLYNLANPRPYARDELARKFVHAMSHNRTVDALDQMAFGFQEERPLKTWLDSGAFRQATGMDFFSMDDVIETFLKGIPERNRQP